MRKNKLSWVNIETEKGKFKPFKRKVIILNKKEGKLVDGRKVVINKVEEITFYYVKMEKVNKE